MFKIPKQEYTVEFKPPARYREQLIAKNPTLQRST